MPPQRRGPYKRYLNDVNIPVSRTTAWRRRKEIAQQQAINNQQQNLLQEAPQHGDLVAAIEYNVENNHQIQDFNREDSDDTRSTQSSGIHRRADHHSSNESLNGSGVNGIESDSEVSERSEPANRRVLSLSDRSSDHEGSEEDSELESNVSTSAESVNSIDSDNDLEELGNGGPGNNVNALPLQAERDNEAGGGNHWLYEGSRLTKLESDVLIMSFIVRWGLEEKSIEHLLQLINCHLPQPTLGSQYLFLKNFPIPEQQKLIFICPQCSEILPDFVNDEVECETCQRALNKTKLKESGNYFVQLVMDERSIASDAPTRAKSA